MSEESWKEHVAGLSGLLNELSCRLEGEEVEPDVAFGKWHDLTVDLRDKKGAIYLIGNGASASMASHMAADLAKNAHLHTEVFSDLSLITAISNDMGYENVFVEPLRRRARAGDMLIAISSSGDSRNVLEAVALANELELTVVTLSAMGADNKLRQAGTIDFYIAAETYSFAETGHAAILHHFMDMVQA